MGKKHLFSTKSDKKKKEKGNMFGSIHMDVGKKDRERTGNEKGKVFIEI